MNTPNPLVPQGSLERQSKSKSTVRIAIFTIISIHAVFFAGLLMQGCRRDETKLPLKTAETTNSLPPLDTGYYPGTQDVAQGTSPSNSTTAPLSSTVTEPPVTLPIAAQPEAATEGKSYTVVKGDTLARIAKVNNVTVGAITKANPNLDTKLKPGQKIQIPAAATPASTTPGLGFAEPGKSDATAGAAQVYTVKPGETLTRIAKQHGLSVKTIRTANNLKSDRLVVGQKLKLPAGHAAKASTTAKASATTKLTATNPAHVTPIAATNSR